MKQLAGGVKIMAALVLGMGIIVGLVGAFDAEEPSVSLIGSAVLLIIGIPCVYYLSWTGWKDRKRKPYGWTKLLLSGLFLSIVLSVFALYHGVRLSFVDAGFHGPIALAAALGLAIGLNDLRCWRMSRKDKGATGEPQHTGPLEEVQVSYRIEGREWVRLNLILFYEMPVFIWLSFIGAGSLLGAVALFASGRFRIEAGSAFMLLLGIFTLSLPPWIRKAALKNLANDPQLNQEIQATLAEDGLRMAGDTIDVRMNWSGVKSARELAYWVVFMTQENRGFFIPKRAISPQQLAAARLYIKRIQTGAA